MDKPSTLDPKSQTTKSMEVHSPLQAVQTTLDKFLSAANIEAVYAPPIHEGENVIIPAAEILSIAGFGMGGGSQDTGENENAAGGGGGGGGRVLSRPVAVIVISPAGVRVEPILDLTKIVLAVLTTLGFMIAMLNRMSNRKPPKLSD